MPTQENRKRKEILCLQADPHRIKIMQNLAQHYYRLLYSFDKQVLSAALLFRGCSSTLELADLYTGCFSGHNPAGDRFLQKGDLLHVGC